MGARRVPRRKRGSTRANPANLTVREMEVLALLAAGRSDKDIAGTLVIWPHTMHHHVSAILRKLGTVPKHGQPNAST
jgi:DNA-binding NarL/FixJ family response regulator